jgi:hypothetical protein
MQAERAVAVSARQRGRKKTTNNGQQLNVLCDGREIYKNLSSRKRCTAAILHNTKQMNKQ